MINFKVSAPGKLNLFGEHWTCDDHNGVMASINRRTTVKFNELLHSNQIKFEFSLYKLNCTILLRKFQRFYKSCTFDETLSEQILHFISSEYLCLDDQQEIVHSFFYLLAYVTYKEKIDIENVTPFQVCSDTQLSNIDLGGVASLTVCLAACFLHWSHLRRNAHHKLNDDDRTKILMYSKSCDKIFGYCRFKSEVTVCTYGSILRYRCKDSWKNDILGNMPSMTILLVDTPLDKDAPKLIEATHKQKRVCPYITNSILDSIRTISDTAFSILREIRDIKVNTETEDFLNKRKKLMPLMRMQQELNEIFTLFNEHMHTVCSIAQRYKLCGKCADSYQGKSAYIWCPSDAITQTTRIILLMTEELRSKGFGVQEIKLAYNGVKIE